MASVNPIAPSDPIQPLNSNLRNIGDLEWAKHLWEEWKYRDEAFHKLVFRLSWFLVLLAGIPFIGAVPKLIKDSLPLKPEVGDTFASIGRHYTYWLFLAFLFLAASWHLAKEYRNLAGVQRRLNAVRGDKDCIPLTWPEFWDRVQIQTLIWGFGFAVFFWFCFLHR